MGPRPKTCRLLANPSNPEQRGTGKGCNDHMTSLCTEASDNSSVAFDYWFKIKHFSWLHWPYFPGLPPMLAPAPPASVLNLFKYTWKSWETWNTKKKQQVQCLRGVTHHIFPGLFLGRSAAGGLYHNLDRKGRTFKVPENETDMKRWCI